ncbi:MAG: Hpt domain-containing protein [Desulfobacula sp.]|nr:Hpt domain-containing protein [Desulfobacula sp.]
MDFQDLASRLGIDDEDFMELVELFVVTTLSDIEKIKKSVQKKNCHDASAAAHSIKGAAGNMGFNDMFELAKTMEMQAREESLDGFDAYITDLEAQVNSLNPT